MKLPKNFTVKIDQKIDDLKLDFKFILFEKDQYRIPIINLYTKEDDENLLTIGLRSHVNSSKGLAHILEHTVLCGSQQYQARDPFFSMLRRSLNTYMNALTAPTFTAYPVGSRNKQDFYNLLDLYVDAVFYPRLTDESIYQEGYRLEISQENPTKITECGVVYNEMKGCFDSPIRRLGRDYSKTFFPNHSSSFVSGGDPSVIRSVTPDNIRKFHHQYYHPNNSLFYFYGNSSIKEILTHLDKTFFSQLTSKHQPIPIPPLGKVTRFNTPKFMTATYPNQTIIRETMVLISYLTIAIESPEDLIELLALRIIDSILTGHDGASFKQALLNAKNSKGEPLLVEISSHLDDNSNELAFTLFCKGCNIGDAKEIKKIIHKELTNISKTPFTKKEISAAIHQEKFADLEIGGSGENYAIELFFRMSLYLQIPEKHAQTMLLESLNLNKYYGILEEKCKKNPLYLNQIITQHLLENNHCLTMEFNPDSTLAAKEDSENKLFLESLEKDLSEKKINQIKKRSRNLKEYQDKDESEEINKLPILKEKDLPKKVTQFNITKHSKPLTLFHHSCFTNSIVYLEQIYTIGSLPLSELPYLRLFSMIITEMGTIGVHYIKHLEEVEQFLGSLTSSILLEKKIEDPTTAEFLFSIQSKSFFNNSKNMFDILKRIIEGVDFSDKKRLSDLLQQLATNMKLSLNHKAFSYAISQAEAPLTTLSTLREKMYGYSFYQFIQELNDNLEDNLSLLSKKFLYFSKIIFKNAPDLTLTCDKKEAKVLLKNKLFRFKQLNFNKKTAIKKLALPKKIAFESSSHQKLELQMAYNSSSLKTIDITHPDAALILLATYILKKDLHEKIREKGGAYSSNVSYRALEGIVTFSSYRDPEVDKTFTAFKDSLQIILKNRFNDKDLFEAKLLAMQKEEKIVPIHMKCFYTYFNNSIGLTKRLKKHYRKRLLKATKEEIIEVVKNHLLPHIELLTRVSYRK